MLNHLEPRDGLASHEVERGLRLLTVDGVTSQVMGALTGGALLVAFALALGASNTVIGLIASVGPLTQLLQIPAIILVERFRRRKAVVVLSLVAARCSWFVVAAIPLFVPGIPAVAVLMTCLVVFYAFSSVASSAFNSWKRDLLPDAAVGRYLAKRLAIATAAGAVVTVTAGLIIDHGARFVGGSLAVYSLLFALGGLVGLIGVGVLGAIPEPRMAPPGDQSLIEVLAEPLRDANFRSLLGFLAAWNFAANVAVPFFSVYMLVRLGLPVSWVLGLSVISQAANVSFFPIWGRLADRLSNRAVLGLSGSFFIASTAMWPFTTLPERYLLTVPLLITIHVLAGISTAGVTLCAGGITLKLAPRGKATAFLAINALTSGIAATIAPVLAGMLADLIESDRLNLAFTWTSSGTSRSLTAIDLQGLDFLFLASVVLGLYALHRLLAVREEGVVEDDVVATEFYDEVRKAVRHVGNIGGMRRLTSFPYALLRPRRGARSDEDDGS